ncbi:GTP 3',8-cyclase MoaA [Winogradskyella bathintestinalis]|uniref:GTP 3',8-cyclase n=1 Tax=Winogradskyella bathintestinalis TaxID=3035208 RepID=A0ABT7ZSD4_9FLAO|nr:GTP 3',8-cyclase MoaA [Winogradskyella bathintestinalis]MDN3491898.1 GTP 3',8-cyclase MoaA [Winogradskyella bathintestinalis]
MQKESNILTDALGRKHNYLRISLTEKCNLRCTYCMPSEGVPLAPRKHLMDANEIYEIAKVFAANGVDKIRLTGGEPLVRKDFSDIIKRLSTLNVKLAVTTNGILVDRFIEDFKTCGLNNINVSLDTLNEDKFNHITRRNQFTKVYNNIHLLIANGFKVKLNIVLIKGFNDNEIINFIKMTKDLPISIRFIEFMPFDGNNWNKEKLVTQSEILDQTTNHFGANQLIKLENEQNFTSRDYKISGHKGEFGIISSVSNPFCDGCNRIRLTANGKIKNCLFSNNETDVLTALRNQEPIESVIAKAIYKKLPVRGGMDSFESLNNPKYHSNNRSMITIGG